MLTPDKIVALNKATGGKMDTNVNANTSNSRIAELTALANNGKTKTDTQGSYNNSNVANPNVFGNQGGGGVVENIARSTIGSEGIGGLGGRPVVAAMTAGATQDVAQHKDQLAQVTNAVLRKIATLPANDPHRQGLLDIVKENQKAMGISDEEMKNLQGVQETQGQNVGNALNSAATLAGFAGGAEAVGNTAAKTVGQQIAHGAITGAEVGGAQGAGNALQDANANTGDILKGTLTGAATGAVLGGATEGVLGGITRGITATKNLATGATDATKNLINGKTLEQVLATPESDVYKLSAPERKAFFDNQHEQIKNAQTAADVKVKTDLAAKSQASQTEADQLARQLQVASRDKVIELRPQIRTAMAKQSATYRNLVDEAIAPYVKDGVDTNELKSFVESRFPDNPGAADAVKSKLGLTTETLNAKPGELPTIQTGEPQNPNMTIGDIYNQTKNLKQDIGSGATKGTKTFTPDDKLTDDAISTLSDYLKSKGVDLSEANKFWSKYAPVRNQLVTEAKPFLQIPVQTKTFANTLIRVAKGADVNNENFISQVEGLVGQPITNENKAILAKLSANEKGALANEVAAQEKLLSNKAVANQSSNTVNNKEFETTRLANRRTILRRIFYTAGGIGIDKIIKNYTGIGL